MQSIPSSPRSPGVSAHEQTSGQAAAESSEEVYAPGFMGPPLPKHEIAPERLKTLWVGLTLVSTVATFFLLFTHSHKVAATYAPIRMEFTQTRAKSAVAPKPSANINTKLPIAPGVIANNNQLAKPWSSQEFVFRDQITGRTSPAIVVRLPAGALWAFSLHTPYGSCDLEYVTDLRKLQTDYGFISSHPMVAEPCSKSLFDLTRYGNAPSGLVRGEVVKGSAFRPPLAIEVAARNDQIVAIRSEQ